MIDLKPTVYTALKNDPALSAVIAGRVFFMQVPTTVSIDNGPCITYYEQNNSPALRGDERELGSESVFVIDVWSKGNTSVIAQAVDNVMIGLRFVREFSGDLYETDTGVYHKSMRYRIKTRR